MNPQSHVNGSHLMKRKVNWGCRTCNKSFNQKYLLERHILTHTDERKFRCNICYKLFRLQATLTQHYTTHSSEKPYVCTTCSKKFSRASSLISHYKTHDVDKPYKCNLCTKAFHQKGNLQNHLFSHTNARPYQCEKCKKGFNQQSNLIHHLKKMHPELLKISYLNRNKIKRSQQKFMEENYFGIIIDAITNEYMENVLKTSMIPFAVLNVKGYLSCIVKIMTTEMPQDKHMLLPVTNLDIRQNANIIRKQDDSEQNNIFLQLPIVAIINFEGIVHGQYIFEIILPHDIELPCNNEDNLHTNIETNASYNIEEND